MFVELIDHLRCLRPHEESWLVATADVTDERDIVEGMLGCPVCRAEYRIAGGIARFADPSTPTPPATADETEAMRLAAFLGLAEPHGFVVLTGTLGAHAPLIHRLADVHLLLVNPPPGAPMGAGLSGLTAGDWLPLASGSAHAVGLDMSATAALVHSAIAALRSGGRLVAPASLALPAGATELARDGAVWVAQRDAAPSPARPIPLRRKPG